MKRAKSVQVVVYRETEVGREYLLLLRHRAGTDAFWQPVSGSLEEGETFGDAARRELDEETGLGVPESLVEIGLVDRFEIAPAWRDLYDTDVTHNVQMAFAARVGLGDVTIDPGEHLDHRWEPWKVARELVRYAPNRRSIDLVESGAAFARRRPYTMELPNGVLELGARTLVMGILNVTPDSFSDGGAYSDVDRAVSHALQMEADGADIIDVGGESTRPGSAPIGEAEERRRIEPVIRALAGRLRIPISIDTTRAETARAAMDASASIINDVSGLRFDPAIAKVAAESAAGLVLMHMRGSPATMQKLPPADDIIEDVTTTLLEAVSVAVERGVDPGRTILDPGIGFGKPIAQSVELLARLDRLAALDRPMLVGTSRKSFLGALTGRETSDRLHATTASIAAAVLGGAHIIRVHDVSPAVDAVRVCDAVLAALGPRCTPDLVRPVR